MNDHSSSGVTQGYNKQQKFFFAWVKFRYGCHLEEIVDLHKRFGHFHSQSLKSWSAKGLVQNYTYLQEKIVEYLEPVKLREKKGQVSFSKT